MTVALLERYDDRIAGVLSCYDRVVITGTLPTVCYAEGMTRFLAATGVRVFDYPRFAMALRDRVRERAASVAAEAGVAIEHIAKGHVRKEAVVAEVLERRGDHPGLVHVISAMEACSAYKPWHDKQTHKTYLRPDGGKCLHYYFYFMDAELGLIYLRVPTWSPFRLQFYCNGHGWLARRLAAEGVGFATADNAFVRIDDWPRAQALADGFSPDRLHAVLDRYAALCCPVLEAFRQSYHWSLMQVEYATDLVFRSAATLRPLYEQLARESILSVKAEQVASFLGRKITPQLAQEVGSQFSTRIEGTCIKHRFASASIKMYDKFGRILRIETTSNDVSFFKHHRKVEHRNEPAARQLAPVKKSIYSLIDLREIMLGCNRRYLEHLSASTTLPPGSEPSTGSPNPAQSTERPSKASTSSTPSTNPSSTPRRTRASTSPASDAPTSSPPPDSPPHVSPGNCAACVTSASSSASPEPTDTTSPASAAPPPPPSAD
jgi:hypothetical protein